MTEGRGLTDKTFRCNEVIRFCFDCREPFLAKALRSSSNPRPRILPRIATPVTHLIGLFSKHSRPALSHFEQGMLDRSHWIVRLRHVQHASRISKLTSYESGNRGETKQGGRSSTTEMTNGATSSGWKLARAADGDAPQFGTGGDKSRESANKFSIL